MRRRKPLDEPSNDRQFHHGQVAIDHFQSVISRSGLALRRRKKIGNETEFDLTHVNFFRIHDDMLGTVSLLAPTVSFDAEFEFALTLLGDPAAADEILRPLIWEIVRNPHAARFSIVQMPDVRLAVFVPPRELPVQRIGIFFRQPSEGLIEKKRLCVEMKERALLSPIVPNLRLAA